MRISVQVRLAVDLKLFIDTLEIAFMCAVVGDDVEHTFVTDQCKIYIHETEEDESHRLLYCTSSQKYSSRCFQDEHHSATNNDALTGKFDVTTIELSAGRRRLQPPIEQLEKHQQQHTTQEQITHHVCRRSLRTGHFRGLATQDRRGDRCQGCMWRLSSSEVNGRSNRLTPTAGYS